MVTQHSENQKTIFFFSESGRQENMAKKNNLIQPPDHGVLAPNKRLKMAGGIIVSILQMPYLSVSSCHTYTGVVCLE